MLIENNTNITVLQLIKKRKKEEGLNRHKYMPYYYFLLIIFCPTHTLEQYIKKKKKSNFLKLFFTIKKTNPLSLWNDIMQV